MAKTIDKEKIFLRRLIERTKDLPLMGLFMPNQKELAKELLTDFELNSVHKQTIDKINALIKTTYSNVKKDKSDLSQQTEITKIINELKNILKLSCYTDYREISLNLQDTDFNEIATWLYDFILRSPHKHLITLNATASKQVDAKKLIIYTINHYYDRITLKYKNYKFEPKLDKKIDDVLEYASKLNEELSRGFKKLRDAIKNQDFVYLCVQNTANCTIDSTFHMLINYVIMTEKIDMANISIDSTNFSDVEKLIKTYMMTWYTYIYDTITNSYEETKYNNYITTHNQQINDILNILIKDSKFQLQYIVYYYLLIHIWIYCQCVCETLTKHRCIITSDNMTITHSYSDNDNEKDGDNEKMKLYNTNYVSNAYIGPLTLLRISNRIGNYILQEFWARLGNSFDTTNINNYNDIDKSTRIKNINNGIIGRHNVLFNNYQYDVLFGDDQHDVLFSDLDYTGINFNGYLNCHETYKKRLVKYYDGIHADVMLYIEKEGSKPEWILINDDFQHKTERDENNLIRQHVVAGIYVVNRDHGTEEKKVYSEREPIKTISYYTPSAIFFKGGAIISLLIVICIVAIVVCVVIYLHDHYWLALTKTITKEKNNVV